MFAKVARGVFFLSMATALASCNSTSGLGFGKSNPPADAGRAAAVVQGVCPSLELRSGTAFYRTYANGGKDDPEKVIYQASLADSTRACTRNESALNMKVVVQGRLVAGPVGKAGTVQLPIRVEAVQGDQVLYSETTNFPVTLTDADMPQQFLFTKDVTGLPGDVNGLTKIYVGFDQGPAKKKR